MLGHFEAAGDKGVDTHELSALMRLSHGAAQHHIENMRRAGLLVKAEKNGSRPARYWLREFDAIATAHVYPFTQAPKVSKAKLARSAPVAEQCIALIRQAGRRGIDTIDLAEKMGMSRESVLNRIQAARLAGTIVKRWNGSKTTPAVWYMAGIEPLVVLPKTTTIRAANTGLDKSAPAIIPKGLKITQCPGADPGARWRATTAPSIIDSQESRPWAAALTTRS